jgi:hypothetical protein
MKSYTPGQVRQMNKRVPEIWGATRVAQELNCEPSNLARVARLPEPVQDEGRGRLWRADVIRAFAEARRNGKH